MNRTERLLDLLALLVNARRPVSFDEIRQAFPDDYGEDATLEAARRKFERDKKELLDLGIPLEWVAPASEDDEDDTFGEGGGYVVDRRRAFLPPLALTDEDVALLYLAGLATAADPTFPFADALRLALRKLELGSGVSPGEAPRGLHIDRTRPVPLPFPDGAAEAALRERLAALTDAARRRKRVKFDYGPEGARDVEPYGLFWRDGRWSLVGRDGTRARLFLLHRAGTVTVNSARPGTPDFEVPPEFRLADWTRRPPHLADVHAPLTVVLDVAPEAVWLAERELLARAAPGDGASTGPSSGSLRRVEVETTNADAVVAWVLAMGPRVRVVGPPALRARVVAALRRLAEVHA